MIQLYKLKQLNFDIFMKKLEVCDLDPKVTPQGGDGANKNFRAIPTIMPNMNEIHQRVFKI